LTDDPNDYEGVSVSRDGNSVLTVAITRKVDVWMQEFDSGSRPAGQGRQLTFGENVANGLGWTANDHIVYSSTASGNSDIWIMDSSGEHARQLTTHQSADTQPVASPDDRYIIFVSTRTGERQIWRMGMNGENPVQLTIGPEPFAPTITADSKFVIYYAQSEGGGGLFRVPMDGGTPELVADGVRRFPAASPDGSWLASSCRPPGATNNKICVAPINNLAELGRVYEPQVGANSPSKLSWTGKEDPAFTYIVNNRGVENLWNQSLDGKPPTQVTDYNEGYIYAFDWSPDGKRLICGRGNTSNTAMLFTLEN
jgi:Tol biopolymer transport system component